MHIVILRSLDRSKIMCFVTLRALDLHLSFQARFSIVNINTWPGQVIWLQIHEAIALDELRCHRVSNEMLSYHEDRHQEFLYEFSLLESGFPFLLHRLKSKEQLNKYTPRHHSCLR